MELWDKDIRTFLTIASEESLNRAAKKLGVTPASLSILVARLEKKVGKNLFERSSKGVRLSSDGRALYEKLKELSHVSEAGIARCFNENSLPELRVGMGYDDAERYVIPAFQKLAKELPPLKLFCRPSVDLYRAVEDNQLDFAIVAWPTEPLGILLFSKLRKQFGALVALKKNFGHLSKVKTRQELVDQPWILMQSAAASQWMDALDNKYSGYICMDFALQKKLLFSGKGIADVELDLFSREELKKLVIFKLPDDMPDPYTYLVYRKNTSTAALEIIKKFEDTYFALLKKRQKG